MLYLYSEQKTTANRRGSIKQNLKEAKLVLMLRFALKQSERERGRGGIKNNFEDLLCVAFSLLLSLGIATVFHFLGSLKGQQQQQNFAAHTGLFGVC